MTRNWGIVLLLMLLTFAGQAAASLASACQENESRAMTASMDASALYHAGHAATDMLSQDAVDCCQPDHNDHQCPMDHCLSAPVGVTSLFPNISSPVGEKIALYTLVMSSGMPASLYRPPNFR